MNLKNYSALSEQLTNRLMEIDAEFNSYGTDLYVDYDEVTQTGKLVEKVSDNWYYTSGSMVFIGSTNGTYEDATHWIEWEDEAAEMVEMPLEQLKADTAENLGMDIEDVGLTDMTQYIRSRDDLYEKVLACYRDWQRDNLQKDVFESQAEEMLSREFEEAE